MTASATGPERPWSVAKATALVPAARPARGPAAGAHTDGSGGAHRGPFAP